MPKITTLEALHAHYEAPVPSSLKKVAQRLTPLYRRWIEGARFAVLSTAGPEGVHGSPRGDDGPVVRVVDETTLMIPDWWGNNRLDCLRDIVQDGRAALLFLVPGTNTTVRVNGRAFLTDDEDLRRSFAKGDRLPATVIVLEVAEVSGPRATYRRGCPPPERSWPTCRMGNTAARTMSGITRSMPNRGCGN